LVASGIGVQANRKGRISMLLGPWTYRLLLLSTAIAFSRPASILAQAPIKPVRDKIGEVFGKPVYRDELRPTKESPLEDELHRVFLEPVLEKYCAVHRAELEPTQAQLAAAEAAFEKYSKEEPLRRAAEIRESLRLVDKELAKKDSEFRREFLEQKQRDMQEMLKAELAAKPADPLKDKPFADELKEVNDRLVKTNLPIWGRISLLFEKWSYERELKRPYRTSAALLFNNRKIQRHFYDHFGGGRVLWQQAGYEAFDAYHRWLESEEKKGDFTITDPKLRQAFYGYWTLSHTPFLINDPERIRAEFLEPDWVPRPAPR
jgi:hypothetical protein